jgi:putative peptide zinc metalloprotease protein
MSDAAANSRIPQLRRDLRSIVVDGRRRAHRIVVDDISGCFTRVSDGVWRVLHQGDCEDLSLWQEARQAGWTRERTRQPRRTFSPLFFRVPIVSIDGLASYLGPRSWPLFSVSAMVIWAALIVLAFALALSHHAELLVSIGSLRQFLTLSNPFWLAALFVGTKIAHELAHAVMCRRMGSRCGSIGLLVMCGIPCPYCDVTDTWRQPSALRRAAVMSAGIYVELIIAALATFVWLLATDGAIRLHALNAMVICSISTIAFNANPLLRYDGYYVLADLVGSTNLRQEASESFRAVVTSRIAGDTYGGPRRRDRRSISLAGYHVTATLYRVIIAIAIATLCLRVAGWLNLRPLAIGVVIATMIALATRSLRRLGGVVHGLGRWSRVPLWRRSLCTLAVGLAATAILFAPLPRFRTSSGWVDAANTSTVFLPSEGMVRQVGFEFAELVRPGNTLVDLQSDAVEIEHARLRGEWRIARLRSSVSRRVTLDRTDTAERWKTLQAAEDAVAAQLAAVAKRRVETAVTAPIGGVLLPARPLTPSLPGGAVPLLRDRVGTAANAHEPWCRISPRGELYAVLVIDARDRTHVDIGSPVRICLRQSPERVFTSTVTSVSAIERDEPSVTRQAAYQVLCPLPEVDKYEMLQWMGKECQGTFSLPSRTLSSDIAQWIIEWLGGKPTTS